MQQEDKNGNQDGQAGAQEKPATKTCTTKLLRDTPVDKDAFCPDQQVPGPHQRVADAIADLIKREAGGVAIALEGGLGAGKSTIVNLLKTKSDAEVFVFDAWSHEGDPLRRVFLEELIGHCLQGMTSKQEKGWKKKQRELGKKVREVETNSSLNINAQTAVAIGFGAVYLAASLLLAASFGKSIPWTIWDRAALVIVLLPAVLATLGVTVSVAWWPLRLGIGRILSKKLGPIPWGVLKLFVRQTDTHVVNHSTESIDPTSIEFQRMFRALLCDYLGKDGKKLVVVLDNLDRVPEDCALKLWATMRVFVDCWENNNCDSEKQNGNWAKRTWLLVPYDRKAVSRLWSSLDEFDFHEDDDDSSEPSRPEMPAAFLDKIFQIRFETPPLMVTDWKGYLEGLMNTAFPDHADTTERHGVYRLSAIHAEKEKSPPTPRRLILYINDIGAIRRQFGDQIPLHHMGYYAILRRNEVDVRQKLLEGKLPEDNYNEVLEIAVEDDLAMMCFNTPDRDLARQLLLRGPIFRALRDGDGDFLSILAEHPGFWPVAESALYDAGNSWKDETSTAINAATALYESGIEGHSYARARVMAKCFARQLGKAFSGCMLTGRSGTAIAALMQIVRDEVFSQELACARIPVVVDTADVQEWADAVEQILKTADELKHNVDDAMTPYVTAERLVEVCDALHERKSTQPHWKAITTKISKEELLEVLQPNKSTEPWTKEQYGALRVLAESKVQLPWPGLIDAIRDSLEQSRDVPLQWVDKLLQALELSGSAFAKEKTSAIKSLATAGFLYHHLYTSFEKKNYAVAARIIRDIVIYGTFPPTPVPSVGGAGTGYQYFSDFARDPTTHPEIVQSLADIIPVETGTDFIAQGLENQEEVGELIGTVLKTLAEQEQLTIIVPPAFVIEHAETIENMLLEYTPDNYDWTTFLQTYVDEESLLETLAQGTIVLENAAFYAKLVELGATNHDACNQWLAKGLKQVDENTWIEAIETETGLLELLAAYQSKKPDFRLGTELHSALEEIGSRILSGGGNLTKPPEQWSSVLGVFDPDLSGTIGKNLFDKLNAQNVQNRNLFIEMFQSLLTQVDQLTNPEHFVRHISIPTIKDGNQKAKVWLGSILESKPGQTVLKEKIKDEDRKSLEKYIKGELESSSEQPEELVCIAKTLGVPIPDQNGDHEAQDSSEV